MAASVRPAVEAIWAALGVAPPPEPIAERYEFTIDETDLTLGLAANGSTILLEGHLGELSKDPREAADQLRRLMRSGLGLCAFNRAALCLPDFASDAPVVALADGKLDPEQNLRVTAIARIDAAGTHLAPQALQDILQWQKFASPILAAGAYSPRAPHPSSAAAGSDDVPADDFVIFQP